MPRAIPPLENGPRGASPGRARFCTQAIMVPNIQQESSDLGGVGDGYPARRKFGAPRLAFGLALGCPSWTLIEPCALRRSLILGESWKTFGRCSWPHRIRRELINNAVGRACR